LSLPVGVSRRPAVPPVTFRAHLRDHPDLPRWLRFIQRDPHQPGYLYGSPTATEVGTHVIEVGVTPGGDTGTGGTGIFRGLLALQVVASNRDTYETVAQRLIVTIVPAPGGDAPYQGEFLVGNRNVEELLPVTAREMFLQATAGVWEQDDLRVTNVTSALDRGGRVPLPIEGRKEGVYVTVGSHGTFSPCLASAASPQSRFRCSLGQQPLASCYDTFAPHFSICWCNLTLVRPPPMTECSPPQTPPRVGIWGCITPFSSPLSIQLFHHTTIHGDTEELRHMATNRDVPRPLSTLPMFNVRTGQRINPMPGPPDGARVPLL
ncbi:SGCA protein, partial [Syrrhaptes paradoxus]|nr:SGCA protein [Syrrhaptes paradoxus]